MSLNQPELVSFNIDKVLTGVETTTPTKNTVKNNRFMWKCKKAVFDMVITQICAEIVEDTIDICELFKM